MSHAFVGERRLHPRFLIQRPAGFATMDDVIAKLMQQVCMLENVSLGGAKIVSKAHYPVGSQISLWAELYESHKHIKLDGEISRVNALTTGDYEYGVKFHELSDEQRDAMSQGLACVARCKAV